MKSLNKFVCNQLPSVVRSLFDLKCCVLNICKSSVPGRPHSLICIGMFVREQT